MIDGFKDAEQMHKAIDRVQSPVSEELRRNHWCFRPHNGKTVIYVLLVNDYLPELCQLTIPNLRAYAERLGAEFKLITERRFSEWPITYEKIQVHELGMDNEWNVLIDADTIIHPDMPDVRQVCGPQRVGFTSRYQAHLCLRQDKYFERDGRDVGVAGGFVVTSHLCHDLWTPLEFTFEEVREHAIRVHILDEYCISRNLAKFGFPYTGLLNPEVQHMACHLGAEGKSGAQVEALVRKAEKLLRIWATE